MANASHRLLMRCNNEVTQWELSWIIGVGMHIVSRTRSSNGMVLRQTHSRSVFSFHTTVICKGFANICPMLVLDIYPRPFIASWTHDFF